METAARDARGRFKPGRSGNPKGKRPGTLNRATRLRQWLDDPEADGKRVAEALIVQAAKGNVSAIRLVMERLDPKGKIALEVERDADVPARFEAVFSALAAGAVTPEQALQVARFLDTFSKVDERAGVYVDELDRRETEAEARHQAEIARLRDDFRRREDAYLARLAAAEATAAAASSATEAASSAPDTPLPNPPPQGGRGRAEVVETLPPATVAEADAPRRDPAEYALPWPAGAAPEANALHPTSISRGWHGKSRYGERARPPERDGAPVERPRRRKPPRLPGITWMGA
jgi:hypothetical protein